MRTYLFVNPLSGSYSAGDFQIILSQLQDYGITPEVFRVHAPAEIAAHCTFINERKETTLIIVAGGDGTINAVVNALTPNSTTIAILPLGTSNVLAAEIGILSIKDGLHKIASGVTRSFSVGILEMKDSSYRFLLMAGIGVDGAIVRDVWPLGKKLLKQGAYALSAIKRAMVWDDTMFEIITAEEEITCHSTIICNASRYGGNFILSPDCNPFSTGLSAVCITGNTRLSYLKNALNLFRGTTQTSKDLIRISSSSFEIRGKHPIQIDGDFVGYGPAHVSALADFARIIV